MLSPSTDPLSTALARLAQVVVVGGPEAGFVVVFLFLFLFIVLLAIVIGVISAQEKEEALRKLVSGLRIEGDKLRLPTQVSAELGVHVLKCFWLTLGAGKTRSRRYVCDARLESGERVEVQEIELSRLCTEPFYVYVDALSNEILLRAPGLRILSEGFRDIYVLCLDSSRIPTKSVELAAGSGNEYAKAVVSIDPSGYKATVSHIFTAPKERRVVYDAKAGLYRVVEEYTKKPRAQEARVEICFETTGLRLKCFTIASTQVINASAEGVYRFTSLTKVVAFHKDLLRNSAYTTFKQVLAVEGAQEDSKLVAGYAQGWVRAKLVLNIPLAPDIITEQEL